MGKTKPGKGRIAVYSIPFPVIFSPPVTDAF